MALEKRDLPTRAFRSATAFRAWLDREHDHSDGLWLKIAKKGTGVKSVTYAEALDVALCFGWIDGQKDRYDDTWFLQRFTPRRARSSWSQNNCDKVAQLLEMGLMEPAGLEQVERAKADGRWDAAYSGSRSITVPDDFQAALDANPAARDAFATISRANRYAFLYRIHDAKRPQTRVSRIEKFVSMLAAGETLH
jgi:uncharacterized protein YdeI (YjbR/CyaY-like superfamily)